MTLPPNRIGAVRGPGGSTLDDVVDGLGQVRLAVEGVSLTLEAVAADLRRLTGTGGAPAGWLGLPEYLGVAIGEVGDVSASALSTLYLQRDILAALSRAVGNTGAPPVSTPAPSLYALTSAAVDALTSAAGDNVYNRLGSIRDNSLALLQSLGTLPSTPANQTVKALLQALVDCCNGTPPPPEFLPPEASCNTQPITWVECTLVERFEQGPGGQRVFAVEFPPVVTGNPQLGGVQVTGFESPEPALGSLTNGDLDCTQYDVCIAWSFSADTPLYNYAIDVRSAEVNVPYNAYTSQTPPVPLSGSQYTNFFARDLSNANFVLQANFAFDTGVTPVGKVWVGAACASEF